MRFGLRALLAFVACASLATGAWLEKRRQAIPRTCMYRRVAIETAIAVFETSNFRWARPEPYLIELDAKGVARFLRFDGRPAPALVPENAIGNAVRDERVFRCPAMADAHTGPVYRVGIKSNAHQDATAHVRCLIEPSHNDVDNDRWFSEPAWHLPGERGDGPRRSE